MCIRTSFICKIFFVVFNTGKSTSNDNFPLETPINQRKHDMLTEYIIHSDDSNGSIATFDELIQELPNNNLESEVSFNFLLLSFQFVLRFY